MVARMNDNNPLIREMVFEKETYNRQVVTLSRVNKNIGPTAAL